MTILVGKSRGLVVGDEPTAANPLRHVLSIEGYHVRTAAGVTEALVSLSEWRRGLVGPLPRARLIRNVRRERAT